jgi:DNA primase catalytic core
VNLDDLKDRVRIGDLFRTSDRSIKCPFHADKTPSLSLDHVNNRWRCWGCGAGGSAVDYFVHAEGLDVAGAIRRLAEWAGVELDPLTPEAVAQLSRTERREKCLRAAVEYFRGKLGGEAADYLARRGFTADTLAELQVGYDDRNLGWYVQRHGEADQLADYIACGLVRTNDRGNVTDFLGSRVVFPVVVGGLVRTLTARALGDSEIKYLHLPLNGKDKEPLELGAGLAWLYLEDNLRRSAEVVVCEGPPDTITLHQWGVPAVGLLGVQGIKPHAAKFKGKTVWLAFDADAAGARGTAKAAALLEDAGARAVLVVRPPAPHKDWNDWALAGGTAAAFEALKGAAPTYLGAMIAAVEKDADPEARGAQLEPVWSILARRSPDERDGYVDQLKRHLGISKKACHQAIEAARKLAEAYEKARAEVEGGGEAEVVYQDRRHLVPAMDFAFNSPATACTAVYLPTKRKQLDGSKLVDAVVDDPYLVRVTVNGAEVVRERLALRAMELSKRERKRVPHEDATRGRWRLDPRLPYAVGSFVAGNAPEVDVPRLFEDLRALFQRFIHLHEPRDFDLLAVWVMQSYVFRLFNAVGYLWLNGPRGTAKSTIGEFLAQLCFNADRAGSVTEAVLFRTIEANCSTLVIDEAEKLSNPDPNSNWFNLSLLCNDGYKAGACAKRMEPGLDGAWDPVSFDAYSPKVFASIKDINYVLASRCIRIASEMATAEERKGLQDVAQNMHRLEAVLADLRDRLYCWMLTGFAEVHRAYTEELLESPGLDHLRNREREMWLPLLAIATHIDDRRFPDGTAVPAPDELITWRLVQLQREKQAHASAKETESRLELTVLVLVHELTTSGEVTPVRADFGDGALYVVRELADEVQTRAQETGAVGPDAKLTSRMVSGFLAQLGAIDPKETHAIRDGSKVVKVCRIRQSRLAQAMERYGVAPATAD